jgi:hypothetical protein
MPDASLDLQKAIVAVLKASTELAALVGDRIYDRPPTGAVMPYVSLGAEDWTQTDVSCIRSHEGAVQVDAWSTAVGKPEAKRIAAAVQDALHEADLTLDTAGLVEFTHRITRYFIEGDGLTTHAAMDFRAFTEEPMA